MLDMNMFREHADVVRADHTKRGLPHDNIDKVIELDQTWRNLLTKRTSSSGQERGCPGHWCGQEGRRPGCG